MDFGSWVKSLCMWALCGACVSLILFIAVKLGRVINRFARRMDHAVLSSEAGSTFSGDGALSSNFLSPHSAGTLTTNKRPLLSSVLFDHIPTTELIGAPASGPSLRDDGN